MLRLEGRLQELEERLCAEESARAGAEEALQRLQTELEERRAASEQHVQARACSPEALQAQGAHLCTPNKALGSITYSVAMH